jgi:hypothetical protein
MVAEHLCLPSNMSYGPRDAGAALIHSLPALPVSGAALPNRAHHEHLFFRVLNAVFYVWIDVIPVQNLMERNVTSCIKDVASLFGYSIV